MDSKMIITKFQAAVTEQYNGKAIHHEASKLIMERLLREGKGLIDMLGYKADELYLQTLHALRSFEVASAKDFYNKWQRLTQQRMDAQLFGDSKKAIFALSPALGMKVGVNVGTDITTKALGDSMKLESNQLQQFIEMAEQLALMLSARSE